MSPADRRLEAEDALLRGAGIWTNDRIEIVARRPVVHVRDLKTGILVAYSETAPDFEDAVMEFIRDFS